MAGATRVDAGNWLSRALTISKGPPPWSEAIRTAVAFGAVVAVALALDELRAGLLAAAGMLLAVMRPSTGPYRSRALGLLVPQLTGAVGLIIGQLGHGHGWWTVTMTTLVALVAGLVSSIGNVMSGAGLSLLFLNVIGSGLPPVGAWWLPPLCQFAGGTFIFLLSLLSWRLWRGRPGPEHQAVAAVYARAADLIDALPDPGDARLALSTAMDTAQDALTRHRLRTVENWSDETRWLVGMLNAAMPLMETLTVSSGRGGRRRPVWPRRCGRSRTPSGPGTGTRRSRRTGARPSSPGPSSTPGGDCRRRPWRSPSGSACPSPCRPGRTGPSSWP
ncbi:FUSC family membrane protein [Actinomadura sp. NPDC023710]|uniref:FUSC family membrane protein n=1 Tax=Actinomadura sp. NPDC023710 TaxID=3158219 RepID=UPI00340529CC